MLKHLAVLIVSLFVLCAGLSAPAKAFQSSDQQGLSTACHAASLFVGGGLMAAGFRLYRLSESVIGGITWVSATYGPDALDQVCDATAEELLEYAKSHAPMEYGSYIDEYCDGDETHFSCADPNLSVGSGNCSMFEVCPDFPTSCPDYITCMNVMLGTDGFTTNELISASSYFAVSWDQGYWYTPNTGGDSGSSWDIE